MRPDLDRKWQIRKVRAKAVFLSKLSYYHEKIVEAINKRKLIFDGRDAVRVMSLKKWRHLSILLQHPVDALKPVDGKVRVDIEDKTYVICVSRSKIAFLDTFSNQNLAKESFNLITLTDLIIIDSVLYAARDDANLLTGYAIDKLNDAVRANNYIEATAWATEINHFSKYLELLSFSAYIGPRFRNYIFPQVSDIAAERDMQRALAVYQTVEQQLATNVSARQHFQLLDQIIDETANGLNNGLDISHYSHLLDQLPLDRSWGRIIGFSCLAVLAAAIVVAATLLAITSLGIASPLAIYGVAIAVNHIVGAYAAMSGIFSLGIMCGAIFFAAKGKKNEVVTKANDYLQDLPAAPALPGGAPVVAGMAPAEPGVVPPADAPRLEVIENIDEDVRQDYRASPPLG